MVVIEGKNVASIYLDKEALSGVKKIAGKVAEDFKRVSGKAAKVVESADVLGKLEEAKDGSYIVAGTIGASKVLDELARKGLIDLKSIQGKNECYGLFLLDGLDKKAGKSAKGSVKKAGDSKAGKKLLVVAGSDKRGTIYGLFKISEIIGVSPWVWYGDVAPVKRDYVEINESDLGGKSFISKEPSVRYRGLFINDEWPSFGNWTFSHFDGFTTPMYDHVFELILRLKGNYLWPAMWTSNFSLDGPGLSNAELADEYGIVMSNSHHEPCLRHSEEWDLVKGDDTPYGSAWNFDRNKEGLTNYWRDGLLRNGKFENIITMGMRGERDSEILGTTATLQDNIDYLKEVITTQNQLIKETINEDLDKTSRMLAIYKEVEGYFHGDAKTKGLKYWDGLDGITCMLCEDNFGNLRTLPEDWQRDRKGGWGMYYHFDYHGDPVSYEWVNSTSIARTCDQMSQAYDFGVREIWIVNVGDLKPQELPLSYFMDLAYDMEKWGASNPHAIQEYMEKWTSQQFAAMTIDNPGRALELKTLLEGYSRLNYIRKPEALYEDTYHPCHYGEADAVLTKASELMNLAEEIASDWGFDGPLWKLVDLKKNDKIREKLMADENLSAYVQLVYFPVMASMNQLMLMVNAGKNDFYAKRGALVANKIADEMKAEIALDRKLKDLYHAVNNGKWDHLMRSEHIGFRNWNDEECSYPIRKYVETANKPRMIVRPMKSEQWTCGGDWTRKTLLVTELLDPACKQTSLEILKGSEEGFKYEVLCDAEWLKLSRKEGSFKKGMTELSENLVLTVDTEKLASCKKDKKGYQVAKLEIRGALSRVFVEVPVTCASYVDHFVPVLPEEYVKMVAREGSELYLALEMTDGRAPEDAEVAELTLLEDFGRFQAGRKAFPVTKTFKPGKNAPAVEFDFVLPEKGEYQVTLITAPDNPVIRQNELALGMSVNGKKIQVVGTVPKDYVGGERSCSLWAQGVLTQSHEVSVNIDGKKGANTLTIYGLDSGVVLERVLIQKNNVRRADGYLGKVPMWVRV